MHRLVDPILLPAVPLRHSAAASPRPTTFNDDCFFPALAFIPSTPIILHHLLFTLHLRSVLRTIFYDPFFTTTTTQMAATPTTAAGLHAPSKPAACLVVDTIDSGCSDFVEGVDVQFWKPSAGVSVPLDENGKPAFYQECSDAIRYSSECLYISA